MCIDSTIIILTLFWLGVLNAAGGLAIFLVIKFFVRLNNAGRGRA